MLRLPSLITTIFVICPFVSTTKAAHAQTLPTLTGAQISRVVEVIRTDFRDNGAAYQNAAQNLLTYLSRRLRSNERYFIETDQEQYVGGQKKRIESQLLYGLRDYGNRYLANSSESLSALKCQDIHAADVTNPNDFNLIAWICRHADQGIAQSVSMRFNDGHGWAQAVYDRTVSINNLPLDVSYTIEARAAERKRLSAGPARVGVQVWFSNGPSSFSNGRTYMSDQLDDMARDFSLLINAQVPK